MEVNGTNVTLQLPCSNRPKPTQFAVVIQIAVYCILLAFSVLGNSLVMLVVSRTNEIRATVNFFIFNMAVSDLIFTIVITPREITEVVSDINRPWFLSGILGSATCKLCYFIQDVCTAVSMLTLVAIATDRYYAIVFPMRSGVITSKLRKVIVISIWIIAMGFVSPDLYVFRIKKSVQNTNLYECFALWDEKPGFAYFLISSAFLFILPLMIMMVIYSIILVTIRRRKIPGSLESSRARRHKERRNRRVLKMVLAVLLAFLVCWLPCNIYIYMNYFGFRKHSTCNGKDTVFVVTLFLAYTNAAINPFIYFAFSENYRRAAVNIIKCKSKRQLARRENTSLLARASSVPASVIKNRTLKLHLELNDMTALEEVQNGEGSE